MTFINPCKGIFNRRELIIYLKKKNNLSRLLQGSTKLFSSLYAYLIEHLKHTRFQGKEGDLYVVACL